MERGAVVLSLGHDGGKGSPNFVLKPLVFGVRLFGGGADNPALF
jgi:hypothetical protein